MRRFFSSRGALLELIYEMQTFHEAELLARYRQMQAKYSDSDENILDYLGQLTQINILKKANGKFVVASPLRD